MAVGASAKSPNKEVGKISDNQLGKEFDEAIKILEKYVEIQSDGTLFLIAPNEITEKINNETYLSIVSGMSQVNTMIQEDYLVCNSDLSIDITDKYIEETSLVDKTSLSTSSNIVTTTRFGGINGVEWFWWGFKVYLSDSWCNMVVGGMSISAGLALFIPDPIILKAVAAGLAISAGIIGIVNADSTGVVVRFNYLPISPFVYVTGISAQNWWV